MDRAGLRTLQQRTTVTVASAAALATICAGADLRPAITLRAASQPVELVATIDETPTTIGLADSNLVRLGTEDLIDEQLDMMQALGVQNVRIGISWISTQFNENGNYFWGATDYVINEAHRRGMGVLGVLHETPAWAGSPPLSGTPNLEAFGRFAGAVAERYEGKVSALEVWNEPNGKFFLNPVSPANYAAMVQTAYTAIKAHDDPLDPDDDITVVAGVLGSGRTVGDDFTMNPIDFLQGMYDAGAHGFFDAFSFHPYHYDIPFSEGETQSDSPILQLRAIRALMEQYGDGALKVWASEYGLPTTPLDPQHPLLYNSPEKQAKFLADFLDSWRREEGTGPIFIYSTRDLNTGSPSDQDNFGIWETDWDEKPAVQVIRDFLDSLDPSYPILEAIRNAVNWIVETTAQVINGIVDIGLAVAEAFIDATVWVVKTIAQVTVNVIDGIVDLTSKVVHGIAEAISNTVTWVVDKVKSCLGIDDPEPPATETGPTSTAFLRNESRLLSVDVSDQTVEPKTGNGDTGGEPTESVDPETPAPGVGEAEVVEPETVEPEIVTDELTEIESDAAEEESTDDETVEDEIRPEIDEEVADEDEAATEPDTETAEAEAEAADSTTPSVRSARTADTTGPRSARPN
ncbi:cellulase family glycosylhydrolase [Mycolicibacterium bacteremicum]|uniref:cellulase family glycosylhydrolase n=1 Tax=Mycolicibacterium bacteremicum TaxID=564198 RepID=UPI0026EBA7C9|nr:cellulase family glycosylhydrolase [Mycolicibacterium bacteremicum]